MVKSFESQVNLIGSSNSVQVTWSTSEKLFLIHYEINTPELSLKLDSVGVSILDSKKISSHQQLAATIDSAQ